HHELRPPRDRRRDGGGVPQDAQADAGEPAGDVTVNAEVGTRNAEHLRTVPSSHFHSPRWRRGTIGERVRAEELTSELQSPYDLVCRLLLEKKKTMKHLATPD